ncbi:ABC-type spermidine/putrescine transport system permease component II-like protein [Polymorphum gilvum SL003B-26A1]|uniref:ABC-type spermidine/putrescine transport system permease component II-like protein n=1 Tax=Polymorphum gilvum (strain LMG 25793 / CGMCC 1.9160 / SL003B-26A1) TaxID=991905 RepID=F2J2V1_POLGS|nr:ABC-type spermidine/putrescine transport system permease component II-like protein [Polymorphum gilvum SL003B-26A1]
MVLLLTGPVALGLAGTLLPAFGYLPALGAEHLSLAPLRSVLATPGIVQSIGLSLGTGLAATALSLAIVIAFTAAWHDTRAFARLRRLISPLLAVPHAAAAFGLAFLIAPSGFLMRLVSPWATGFDRPPDLLVVNDPYGLAMTAGLVVKEVPFLFLMTLAALPQTDGARLSRVAENLGYGKTTAWLKAVFPLVYAQIRLPVLAVLAYSTSVVDVALILGPTTPAPLAPRILAWMGDPDLSLRLKAAAGALVQLALSGAAIGLWIVMERVLQRSGAAWATAGARGARDRGVRLAGLAAMALVAGTAVTALALLALWSVAGPWRFPDALPGSLTVGHWTAAAPLVALPLLTTLLIGGPVCLTAAALSAAVLDMRTRSGRRGPSRARVLLFMPLLVPQIAFLLGLQVLFLTLRLDASFGAVAVAHLVFVLPYVFLSLADPWDALDPRYRQVALTLGASESRTFWLVRLPLLLRAVLTAAAIGFAVSVAQYLPTVLIGGGRFPTVTTESVALASGGSRPLIAVHAVLQMLLPLAGFMAATAIPALLFRNRQTLKAVS